MKKAEKTDAVTLNSKHRAERTPRAAAPESTGAGEEERYRKAKATLEMLKSKLKACRGSLVSFSETEVAEMIDILFVIKSGLERNVISKREALRSAEAEFIQAEAELKVELLHIDGFIEMFKNPVEISEGEADR